MKKSLFLPVLLASLFFSACHDLETNIVPPVTDTDVDLTFKATFDGDQLEKEKVYDLNGWPIKFLRFTLYISDLTLVKTSGEEVKLSNVEFFEFFPEVSSDPKSVVPAYQYKAVPYGEYSGIKVGIGVRPDLNAKKPSDFPANHPLAREIEYWIGWKSYIFSKIEAVTDLDDTTPPDFETFLSYHAGSSTTRDIYRVGTISHNFTISEEAKNMNFELDLKKLFIKPDGKFLNLKIAENQYTGTTPSDLGLAEFFMENWANAISISQ